MIWKKLGDRPPAKYDWDHTPVDERPEGLKTWPQWVEAAQVWQKRIRDKDPEALAIVEVVHFLVLGHRA